MARGRSEHGRIERQKILDAMHAAKRPMLCKDIAKAVEQTHRQTIARLIQMRQQNEIAAQMRGESGYGSLCYLPLVKTTSACYAPPAARPKTPAALPDRTRINVTTIVAPGHLVHKGTERSRPLPGSGGQGAVRQRVFVGSCAEMI